MDSYICSEGIRFLEPVAVNGLAKPSATGCCDGRLWGRLCKEAARLNGSAKPTADRTGRKRYPSAESHVVQEAAGMRE